MEHALAHHGTDHAIGSRRRLAFSATLHCMTGCANGEIAGMVIGPWLGLGMRQTVALAVTLAFITGFGLTMIPLVRSGMAAGAALRIAYPVNLWLIGRGKGHAVVHGLHAHH